MAVKQDQIQGELVNVFLSRLCGGEVAGVQFAEKAEFLSRLCGGEDKRINEKAPKSFSKPPMWR